MRYLILICFSLVINFNLYSQSGNAWIEMGVNGGGGLTVLTNKNFWNDQKVVSPHPSFGQMAGIKLSLNFLDNHEVLINPVYCMRNQKYSFDNDTVNIRKSINLRTIDVNVLYRNHNSSGGYVEIGPQFNFVSSASEKVSDEVSNSTSNFNKSFVSGVFGFGANLIQAEAFTWTLGVRLTYSFSDLISEAGGKGSNSIYPFNDRIVRKTYESYKPTHAFTFMLNTEFNFDLGYFAKSKCKRKRIAFLRF